MAGAKPLAERSAVHVVLLLSESPDMAATGKAIRLAMPYGAVGQSTVNGRTMWLYNFVKLGVNRG